MNLADLFRRAASRLNGGALAATPGPWYSLDNGDRVVHHRLDGLLDYVVDEPMSNSANAAFIAMMHPGVAARLARLFQVHANLLDAAAGEAVTGVFAATELLNLALAVLDMPVGDPGGPPS